MITYFKKQRKTIIGFVEYINKLNGNAYLKISEKSYLRELKVSIRQIERLTGISRGIIQKA